MPDPRFYKPLGPKPLGVLLSGLKTTPPETNYLDIEIRGVSDLGTSQSGDITYLGSKNNLASLETACATACFVTSELAQKLSEKSIFPIITETPRAHFARVIPRLFTQGATQHPAWAELQAMPGQMHSVSVADCAYIHPSAVIGQNVSIGEDAYIGPYCVVGDGVVIGPETKLISHVSLESCDIGRACYIKPGAVIGSSGFGVDVDESGFVDLFHVGRVVLGDRVSVGAHTTIDRGFLGDTSIGDDVKLDNHVHIAHNCVVGSGTLMAGHAALSGSCVVGKNVQFGGSAALADHIHVGDGARLAARAGVMHNVPAGETWSGIPAMPIREHMRTVAALRKLVRNPKKKS